MDILDSDDGKKKVRLSFRVMYFRDLALSCNNLRHTNGKFT